MKKIWGKYSYTFILIAASFILTVIIVDGMKQNENYITVTVQEGESLWGIADGLSAEHNLTKHEFIAWVEKENGIKNGLIYPGDELVVPIMTIDPDSTTFVAGIDVE